jgi:hypothetical protein
MQVITGADAVVPAAGWTPPTPPAPSLRTRDDSTYEVDQIWDQITASKIPLERAKSAPREAVDASTQQRLKEVERSVESLRSALAPLTVALKQLATGEKTPPTPIQGLTPPTPHESTTTAAATALSAAASPATAPQETQVLPRQVAAQVENAVKFERRVDADLSRPDWVDDVGAVILTSRKVTLSAGPYTTTQECRKDLEGEMARVARQRIERLAAARQGVAHVDVPEIAALRIDAGDLLDRLFKEQYVETVDSSVGEMKHAFVQIEFTPEEDQRLVEAWSDLARQRGLAKVGVASALAVAGLSLIYGLLKVDTWTRGYYSKRIFLGIPAALVTAPLAVWLLRALAGAVK